MAELKLGLFASMTTGGARLGPFFSDFVVDMAFHIVPFMYTILQQLSAGQGLALPPHPEEFVGTYQASSLGISAQLLVQDGNYGHGMYIYQTGSSTPTALKWLHNDTFVMLPAVSDVCWATEDGAQYVLQFSRAVGKVSGFVIQGFLPFGLEFTRKAQ